MASLFLFSNLIGLTIQHCLNISAQTKLFCFVCFLGVFFRKMIAYIFKKCWRKERTGHKEQLFPVKGERAVSVLEHMA